MGRSWQQPPLFEASDPEPVAFSAALAALEYGLSRGEQAKWTVVKLKTYRPCQECAHLQHERVGDFGPRRHPMGPALELCNEHAKRWKTRDLEDGASA